jgi:hypothetical protein
MVWRAIPAIALVLGAACGDAVNDDPQLAFWQSLRSLCGQAFEGRLVEASVTDSVALAAPLVLDVWQCYAEELRLAFHVGDDHSRVWLISPTDDGLSIEHALHGPDGEPLPFSGYGGATDSQGTATMQVFRPDDETLADVPSAVGTHWTLEVLPGERITYRLHSPATGDFRVDFDIVRRAARPPAPWGYTRR